MRNEPPAVAPTTKSAAAVLESPAPAVGPRVDVIGIGVQKAATTWLFRCLAEHADIRSPSAEPPSHKELHYFNREYERGYAWYHRRFEFGPWKTLEFSTLYFHDRDAPERVRRYSPDVKLLLSLRNPIDRAFSQHKHEVRKRGLDGRLRNFWTALEQNPSYVEQGLYATHLERWLEHFDRTQIHIVLYDDIRSRPAEVIADAFRFIGVDPTFRPSSLAERINTTMVPRSPGLERWMRTSSGITRKVLGERIVRAIRSTGIPALVRMRLLVELDAERMPPLTPRERARLGEWFAPEVARLGEMLGRDLSHWQ